MRIGLALALFNSKMHTRLSPPTPPHPKTKQTKTVRYYPDQIQLLSGWVHHTLYLALMAWALSSHFTCGFCLFLPMEFPTWILAVGSIYPERRSDLLFGASFFATRILYHAMLLQRLLRIRDAPVPVWVPTLLAFALHCYWFALWYVRPSLLPPPTGGRRRPASSTTGWLPD